MFRLWLFFLFLCSCGPSEVRSPVLPEVQSAALREQIARVKPLLLWCDGVPAFPRKHNIDGRANCDVGDGLSTLGRVALDSDGEYLSVVHAAIDSAGRPWRAPSYVGKHTDPNSFSRDQLMGVLEVTRASKNVSAINRILAYVKRTGRLCPGDSRCDITPSMQVLINQALGKDISKTERRIDEETIKLEAATVPKGYQTYLVARKLMLHIRYGTLTTQYIKAADTLKKRFPNSLFIRTVYEISHNGKFLSIADDLAACLSTWKESGLGWVGEGLEQTCPVASHGAELVSLGEFLLGLESNSGMIEVP